MVHRIVIVYSFLCAIVVNVGATRSRNAHDTNAVEIVRQVLVSNTGADANEVNPKFGWTALNAASLKGHQSLVEVLLAVRVLQQRVRLVTVCRPMVGTDSAEL